MSKLFKVKFSFSVPDDTDPNEFINSLADSVDEMLGESEASYCFGFFVPDDKEDPDEEK